MVTDVAGVPAASGGEWTVGLVAVYSDYATAVAETYVAVWLFVVTVCDYALVGTGSVAVGCVTGVD